MIEASSDRGELTLAFCPCNSVLRTAEQDVFDGFGRAGTAPAVSKAPGSPRQMIQLHTVVAECRERCDASSLGDFVDSAGLSTGRSAFRTFSSGERATLLGQRGLAQRFDFELVVINVELDAEQGDGLQDRPCCGVRMRRTRTQLRQQGSGSWISQGPSEPKPMGVSQGCSDL